MLALICVALTAFAEKADRNEATARPFNEFHITYAVAPEYITRSSLISNGSATFLDIHNKYYFDFITKANTVAGHRTELLIDVIRHYNAAVYRIDNDALSFLYESYAARLMIFAYQRYPVDWIISIIPYTEGGGAFKFDIRNLSAQSLESYILAYNSYATNGASLVYSNNPATVYPLPWHIQFNDSAVRMVTPALSLAARAGILIPVTPWLSFNTAFDGGLDIGLDMFVGVNIIGLPGYVLRYSFMEEARYSLPYADLKLGVAVEGAYHRSVRGSDFNHNAYDVPPHITISAGVDFRFSPMLFEL